MSKKILHTRGILLGAFMLFVVFPSYGRAATQAPGCYSTGEGGGNWMQNVDVNGNCPAGEVVGGGGTVGGSGTIVPNNLTYTPLEPLPGQSTQSSNFCQLLNLVFKYLIYLGGAIAVLFLVLGGIGYMVFEVVNKRTQARERIKSSVIGLLVLLGSWIILSTVNPTLVNACNVLSPTTTGVISSPQAIQQNAINQAVIQCNNGGGTIQTIPPTQSGNNSCSGQNTFTSCAAPSTGSGFWNSIANGFKQVFSGQCQTECNVIQAPTTNTSGMNCIMTTPVMNSVPMT